MFRKQLMVSALMTTFMIGAVLMLTGCTAAVRNNRIEGKRFVYEKEGFPNEFSIRLDSDGSFTYYEGFFSSYVGTGSWQLDGDILTLRERDYSSVDGTVRNVYYFNVDDDGLSYISEGSDKFMFVDVSNGERFIQNEKLTYYM